jgi:alanyl-tRNA synthetase
VTTRLYQTDTYATEFESAVTSVRQTEDGWAIVLDATLFYPESGGQPCDTGWLEGARIERVIDGDDILHMAATAPGFEAGRRVLGKVDWARRFLNMQQHTGQHILSQAFLKILGANTVSSRLGLEHSTIDVGALGLGWADMERVERAANAVVYEDRPVKIYDARPDQLRGLRAKKEPAGDVLRIVEVSDFDISPCGGTHCRQTGEVGIVKIIRWEKVRETTRVEFLCGGLAEADYFWKSRAIVELAQAFTTKDTGIPEMVRDLAGANSALRKETGNLRGKLMDYEIRDLEAQAVPVGGASLVTAVFDDKPPAELREVAARLTAPGGRVALVASRGERLHLVFARSADVAVDMRPLMQAATAVVDGKGGGKPEVCEGGGKNLARAAEALEAASGLLKLG